MSADRPNETEEIIFGCKECGKMIAIDPRAAGMDVNCPYCDAAVVVPEESGKAVKAAQSESVPGSPPPEAPPAPAEERPPEAEGDSGLPPPRAPGEVPKLATPDELVGGPSPGEIADAPPEQQPSGRRGVPMGGGAVDADQDSVFAALARGELEVFKAQKQGRKVVFGCPFCAKPIEIKTSEQGKNMSCPDCSNEMEAPDLGAGTEAKPLSGQAGRAGSSPVHLPRKRHDPAVGRVSHEEEHPDATDEEVPHRLNDGKVVKLVPRDEAEAGFDHEQAWETYPDAHPVARAWGRRLKRLAIVGMLAVMAAAVAASIVWIIRSKQEADPAASGTGDGAADETPARRAMRLCQEFSNAVTIRERLEFVRNPTAARHRMQRYYALPSSGPLLPLPDPLSYEEAEVDGVRFARMETVSGGEGGQVLFFEIAEDGSPALDWESAVAYCDVRLGDFDTAPPPRPAQMRVLVRPSDYYNFEFSDANAFVCYEITDVRQNAKVYGYALRDSAVDKALAGLAGVGLEGGGSAAVSCTLLLRVVETPKRRDPTQVWIEEFVAEGWLLP